MKHWFSIIRSFLLQPFAKIQKSNEEKEQKLVMTLLVKNEVDVIRLNLDFHLSQGVDFIIATDNMSDDGTYEILVEYEAKGVLHLIRETSLTYDQANWVNRMGQLAYSQFHADFVFHCDGDEFWTSSKGNLKNELGAYPLVDVFNVKFVNVMLEDLDGKESFPKDARYVVKAPLPDSKKSNLIEGNSHFLFYAQPKVMYKIICEYLSVNMGNHDVKNHRRYVHRKSRDIIIYHFPVRSKKQFFQKVILGGSAITKNKNIPPSQGSHLRKWYATYLNGELDAEYKKLIIKSDKAKRWIDEGVIEVNNDFCRILGFKPEK